MRRPLLSTLALVTLSLSVALAVAWGTTARDRVIRVGDDAQCSTQCPIPCSRCPASRVVIVSAGERHGNPALVPHAFVY